MRALVFLALVVMAMAMALGMSLSDSELFKPYTGPKQAELLGIELRHKEAQWAEERRHQEEMNRLAEAERMRALQLQSAVAEIVPPALIALCGSVVVAVLGLSALFGYLGYRLHVERMRWLARREVVRPSERLLPPAVTAPVHGSLALAPRVASHDEERGEAVEAIRGGVASAGRGHRRRPPSRLISPSPTSTLA